ncbi:hypothetical protein L7F22_067603 [Adiantum nelumboides]|nr:hypothetical protein [Adiantum nelumboides]
MASLRPGKDQGAEHHIILSKEKLKDGSKLAAPSSKSTKKQLPLPPSQIHHQYQAMLTLSPSVPSLVTMASSSTSASPSPSTLPVSNISVPSSSASSASPIACPIVTSSSSSSLLLSGNTLSPTMLLREVLNNIAMQRNQVLGLINTIDPSFLAGAHPKSVQEQKLLNQVAELQGKILDATEEIHRTRAKNAQLEQQLTSLQGRRGAC